MNIVMKIKRQRRLGMVRYLGRVRMVKKGGYCYEDEKAKKARDGKDI